MGVALLSEPPLTSRVSLSSTALTTKLFLSFAPRSSRSAELDARMSVSSLMESSSLRRPSLSQRMLNEHSTEANQALASRLELAVSQRVGLVHTNCLACTKTIRREKK